MDVIFLLIYNDIFKIKSFSNQFQNLTDYMYKSDYIYHFAFYYILLISLLELVYEL